jgi:hypothetical protein
MRWRWRAGWALGIAEAVVILPVLVVMALLWRLAARDRR